MRAVRAILPALLFVGAAAHADDDVGRTLYLRYCASCHGRTGIGDGPVAPSLGQKPADLTRIAAEHGGEFPFVTVCEAIDGTRTVRAHGVSEMPVWGDVFQAQQASPLEQQIIAAGKVMAIARYVRTLQRDSPPPQ